MIITREQMEQNEILCLAPYACKSSQSRGRVYPQPLPYNRTGYQQDRDRVLHSTAFRRLEYKTQVFINDEGDHYRTRLTHTLEVTQIGRSIAAALGANSDLTEAVCLVHDIGHPPFGHTGETILDHLMSGHGGFEHNAHTYRMVTELESHYPDFPGLNLTLETLEGILKHETNHPSAVTGLFDPNLRGHLEGQITDVSDSLAYTAHDVDDGLRSGMITPLMLQELELWKAASEGILPAGAKILTDLQRHQIVRKMIGLEIDGLLKSTEDQIQQNHPKSVDDVRCLPYNLVVFDAQLKYYNQQMKNFLMENMYQQYRVVRMADKAEQVITELFHSYFQQPSTLPPHVFDRIESKGLERTICDYIAGMTDRFAMDEHQKIKQ